jgi:hypothetical protein
MKLTRERKIYAAVLGLGLAVVGYDQLTAPASADAASEPQATLLMASAPASNKQNNTAHAGDGPSLAVRLSELAAKTGPTSPDQIRDAFVPSQSWLGKGALAGDRIDRAAADKFVQRHRLGTVATSASGDIAVVDDKLMQIGSKLDGFTLISVTTHSALFDAGNGVQARLALASGR